MLNIDRPPWLFAKTTEVMNTTALVVYRSVLARETGPIYTYVNDFIKEHKLEVVRKGMFIDAELMWGEGECTLHVHRAHVHKDWDSVDMADMRLRAVKDQGDDNREVC